VHLHLRRHPFELHAILAVPLQRHVAFLEFHAADLGQKIEMPIVAAEFAVGDALQAGVFLELYDFADRFILDLAQLSAVMFLRMRWMRACRSFAGRRRLPT
jgi:hypothetical protein